MEWFGFLKKQPAKGGKDLTISCPRCSKKMVKKTREGLTIDKCEKCGGIWLDKGELQKIAQILRQPGDASKSRNKSGKK